MWSFQDINSLIMSLRMLFFILFCRFGFDILPIIYYLVFLIVHCSIKYFIIKIMHETLSSNRLNMQAFKSSIFILYLPFSSTDYFCKTRAGGQFGSIFSLHFCTFLIIVDEKLTLNTFELTAIS